jgi:thiosulfate dehydrogenase [quinone] large subunit
MSPMTQHHNPGQPPSLAERYWPSRRLPHLLRTSKAIPLTSHATRAGRGAAVWLVLRVIFGVSWIQAAWPKLTDPGWMSTGVVLQHYLEKYVAVHEPPRPRITIDVVAFDWYNTLLQSVLDSESYVWLARMIAVGELLIGLALILGVLVGVTASFSLFTSLNLGLAGSARTNCFFLLVSLGLLYAWQTAGFYGLDRWLMPRLHGMWTVHQRTTVQYGEARGGEYGPH